MGKTRFVTCINSKHGTCLECFNTDLSYVERDVMQCNKCKSTNVKFIPVIHRSTLFRSAWCGFDSRWARRKAWRTLWKGAWGGYCGSPTVYVKPRA